MLIRLYLVVRLENDLFDNLLALPLYLADCSALVALAPGARLALMLLYPIPRSLPHIERFAAWLAE